MTAIHLLEQQQGKLMRIMAELAATLEPDDSLIDEPTIVECLGRLQRTMRRHTMLKPSHLYAIMIAAGDPDLQQTATAYRHEEDELWRQFYSFVSRWTMLGAIRARPGQFRVETLAALAAIEDRGQREYDLLYPVAERLQTREGRRRRA